MLSDLGGSPPPAETQLYLFRTLGKNPHVGFLFRCYAWFLIRRRQFAALSQSEVAVNCAARLFIFRDALYPKVWQVFGE